VPRNRASFGPALRVVLWLVGLLIALMTGMLSTYLVLTAGYVGSKVVARLRSEIRETVMPTETNEPPRRVGSGEPT